MMPEPYGVCRVVESPGNLKPFFLGCTLLVVLSHGDPAPNRKPKSGLLLADKPPDTGDLT